MTPATFALDLVASSDGTGVESLTPLIGWTKWVGLIVCVMSMACVGGLFAYSAFNSLPISAVSRFAWVLIGASMISGAASIVGFALQ